MNATGKHPGLAYSQLLHFKYAIYPETALLALQWVKHSADVRSISVVLQLLLQSRSQQSLEVFTACLRPE